MGDIFKHFIEFIKDKSTSWGFKSALFISIIGLIFASDYYLNFSYNYHINSKVDQLKNIQSLKKVYLNDSVKLSTINKMENGILSKKHYSERLSRLFLKDSIKSEKSDIKDQNNNQNNTPKTITNKPIRSLFWMTFSSNYVLIFTFLILIFLPFIDSNTRTSNGMLGWFASMILLSGFIIFITWITYQIPLIYNKPYLNYILNAILHTPVGYLIFKYIK